MKEELTYWMALAHTEQMWTRRKNEIIVECFNRHKTIVDFFSCDEDAWRSDYSITDDEAALLRQSKSHLPNYAFQTDDLLGQGYSLIPITSADYPRALKANLKYNAPILLYAKGDIRLLNQKSIAIVGSRAAKPISLAFADSIARKAVAEDCVVVSGYAKGIDRQAMESALASEGKSIIVLPQGITTFASGFTSLHKSIRAGRLTVVSTFAPTAPWSVAFAMARNPIIYAMAEQIYVAESDSKGGTFSGVVDGLRKKRTIYVRDPEEGEKNANMQLIGMGAVPVDMQGNIVSTSNDIGARKEEIAELLKGRELTAKEIALRILGQDDKKSQNEIRRILGEMEDVTQTHKRSPIKYTIASQQQLLF